MKRVFIYLLIAVGLFIYAYGTTDGMHNGTHVDGEFYVTAAHDHAAGEMMRNIEHEDAQLTAWGYPSRAYFTKWAPGYPLLLAQFIRAGVYWKDAALVINALAVMLTGLGFLYGLRDYPVWIRGVTVLAFVGYPYVQEMQTWPMTELLYMAGLTWVIALMRQRQHFMIAALLCALTFLLHWRGIALVAAGVLYLVTQRKWVQGIVFGLVSSIPTGIMLTVNYVMTGTPAGPRLPSGYTVPILIGDYARELSTLFVYVGGLFCVGIVFYLLQWLAAGHKFTLRIQHPQSAPDALVVDSIAVHDG